MQRKKKYPFMYWSRWGLGPPSGSSVVSCCADSDCGSGKENWELINIVTNSQFIPSISTLGSYEHIFHTHWIWVKIGLDCKRFGNWQKTIALLLFLHLFEHYWNVTNLQWFNESAWPWPEYISQNRDNELGTPEGNILHKGRELM